MRCALSLTLAAARRNLLFNGSGAYCRGIRFSASNSFLAAQLRKDRNSRCSRYDCSKLHGEYCQLTIGRIGLQLDEDARSAEEWLSSRRQLTQLRSS